MSHASPDNPRGQDGDTLDTQQETTSLKPIFQQGKSYLWIFLLWLALFSAGIFGGKIRWTILSLPAMLALLLAGEIVSGVALDSWWRASYPRGSWQYTALVVGHAAALVGFTILVLADLHTLDHFDAQ